MLVLAYQSSLTEREGNWSRSQRWELDRLAFIIKITSFLVIPADSQYQLSCFLMKNDYFKIGIFLKVQRADWGLISR